MLKYADIIAKLTDQQRIRILTGLASLSAKEAGILGIPQVGVGYMKSYGEEIYPHATAIAHAWDTSLWHAVAARKAEGMRAGNVGFAIAPGAKIKFSPFRKEVSEDPLLAQSISCAYMQEARKAGLTVGAAGCYLTQWDAEWMDNPPKERVVHEYFFRPFQTAIHQAGGDAVLTDIRPINAAFEKTERHVQNVMRESGRILVCEKASEENTVDFISRRIVCLEASANALTAAMNRYRQLKQSMERGEGITPAQIEEEILDHTAIATETVENALDETLEFIFRCRKKQVITQLDTNKGMDEGLALKATLESAVLLKNEGALPLNKRSKIALVGGVPDTDKEAFLTECKTELEKSGFECVGAVVGYDETDYHERVNLSQAMDVCKQADAVILFLGFGHREESELFKTKKLTLPANQLLLADKLAQTGKRVIAVINAGHAPDVEFTRPFAGLMVAPLTVRGSAKAIVQNLTGKHNPCGKLAYTLYAGSERGFEKARYYKKKTGMKCGPFVGYRYYDTADMRVGYPFGYGLSYTSFKYSNFVFSGGKVTFTVENTGTLAGAETPQLYIGAMNSQILRPQKELCAFTKITLAPREKKEVSFKLSPPLVYNGKAFVTNPGEYKIYIGSSVSEIKVTEVVEVDGSPLPADGEHLKDYLQTQPNITQENYTLEAKYKVMKKSVKNLLFGAVALALAVSLAIFNTLTGVNSPFLGLVASVLAVTGVAYFIMEVAERNRARAEDIARIREANEQHFAGAEQIAVPAANALFHNEFDAVETEEKEDAASVEELMEEDRAEYIDAAFTFADSVKEFHRFALERGFKLHPWVAENLFAAMATSKLVITEGLSDREFNAFMLLLSEYFTTGAYVDYVKGVAGEGEDLFFTVNNAGDHTARNILLALGAAASAREKVFFAGLNGVNAATAQAFTRPFTAYLSYAKEKNDIIIHNEAGVNVGNNIPANFWIVLNLAEGVSVEDLGETLSQSVALVPVVYTVCPAQEFLSERHAMNRYQFDFAAEKAAKDTSITEEFYKKVDKLEKYVAGFADYRFGNKLWLRFEKQIALLASLGEDTAEACDTAIASRLLPSVLVALKGKLGKEDKTISETLDFIFGEEHTRACKGVVTRASVATVEKKKGEKAESEDSPMDEQTQEGENE